MATDSGSGKKKSSARKSGSSGRRGRSKPEPSKHEKPAEYTYRGKTIRIEEPAEEAGEEGRIVVDGRDVSFMRTADGITSHAFMYVVFGSPFELAEELIRQWGESKVDPAKSDPGQGHVHGHGDGGHGRHDHH